MAIAMHLAQDESHGLPDDLTRLRTLAQQLHAGTISPTRFQVARVPLGVYEQREAGTYLVRIRFPGGRILAGSAEAVARAARRFGDGVVRVTTRQDLQLSGVNLEDIVPVLAFLREEGLTTRGGGGNTVRNITACHKAGVCPAEWFDVGPYADALTEELLDDEDALALPRKFKIALSGCGDDCSLATVNDVGFIARMRDGVPGFAVYVGGGLGANSRAADLLEEFVPAGDVLTVARAIKRVFHERGNRKSRSRARLRFLVDQIGIEGFRPLYERARAELVPAPLCIPTELAAPPSGPTACSSQPADGFEAWRAYNVEPQRQQDRHLVHIPVALGQIPADAVEGLASVARRYGDAALYATAKQNLSLRWIRGAELVGVHAGLSGIGFGAPVPPVVRNIVACAGTTTCKLGICNARGLASAIASRLAACGLSGSESGGPRIHVSGCPDACGQHPIASIGLMGVARRVHGRLAPHYMLKLGGRTNGEGAILASGETVVPAHHVPDLVACLIEAFARSPDCDDFHGFLAAGGRATAAELATRFSELRSFDQDPAPYTDYDQREPFSLAGRGPGECGAGVLDLIEADLASASAELAEGNLFDAASLACRALLVTQGEEADDSVRAFGLFSRLFLDTSIADQAQRDLVDRGRRSAEGNRPGRGFVASREEVASLVASVKQLYARMDESLRFPVQVQALPSLERTVVRLAESVDLPPLDRSADFRGVTCPLNYVKTKLLLARMKPGEVAEVLLDDRGIQSVPSSVEKDGHIINAITRCDEHWRLVVRRG